MAKAKSLGQQMYETLAKSSKPGEWGTESPPWDDTFECVQALYEKAAKKLYGKWSQRAVRKYKRTIYGPTNLK
jgi:hypothetical protein